jgi:hypothetical protein
MGCEGQQVLTLLCTDFQGTKVPVLTKRECKVSTESRNKVCVGILRKKKSHAVGQNPDKIFEGRSI